MQRNRFFLTYFFRRKKTHALTWLRETVSYYVSFHFFNRWTNYRTTWKPDDALKLWCSNNEQPQTLVNVMQIFNRSRKWSHLSGSIGTCTVVVITMCVQVFNEPEYFATTCCGNRQICKLKESIKHKRRRKKNSRFTITWREVKSQQCWSDWLIGR